MLSLAIVVLWAGDAQAGSLESPGCLFGGEAVTVTRVDAALDLHLSDGRTVHLAGLQIPAASTGNPDVGVRRRALLERWLLRPGSRIRPLASAPDRWGRVEAVVFAPSDPEGHLYVSVQEALLDGGFALARPDPALASCWPTFLALEHTAWRDKVGLWASLDPVRADVADRARLDDRLGSWTLVEGEVSAVRDGRARTYVRFRDRDAGGFSVLIPQSLVRRMAASGTDPHGWVGHRLVVRGLLDDRWGLQIEISSPLQVDLDPS